MSEKEAGTMSESDQGAAFLMVDAATGTCWEALIVPPSDDGDEVITAHTFPDLDPFRENDEDWQVVLDWLDDEGWEIDENWMTATRQELRLGRCIKLRREGSRFRS